MKYLMKYTIGEDISFNLRLKIALCYKNTNGFKLSEELKNRGIDVNGLIVGTWVDGSSVPNDETIAKISEILFDGDKNALLKNDFLTAAVARWNVTHNLSKAENKELMEQVALLAEQLELLSVTNPELFERKHEQPTN